MLKYKKATIQACPYKRVYIRNKEIKHITRTIPLFKLIIYVHVSDEQ